MKTLNRESLLSYRDIVDNLDYWVSSLRCMGDKNLHYNLQRHLKNLVNRTAMTEDILTLIKIYADEIERRERAEASS